MATPIEIRASRRPAVAAEEYRFNGAKSGERAVGAGGEINASDRGELLRKQFQADRHFARTDLGHAFPILVRHPRLRQM